MPAGGLLRAGAIVACSLLGKLRPPGRGLAVLEQQQVTADAKGAAERSESVRNEHVFVE